MKLIAFTGKKGTGKSTVCSYLEEKYGFTRINFKDALVAELKQNFRDLLAEAICTSFTITKWQYLAEKEKWETIAFGEKPPLIRTLMQNYGTNVRRKDSDLYWVRRWEEKIQTEKITILNDTILLDTVVPDNARITNDDVRFLNEAQAVKENGGIIIRLIRPDMEHTDTHQSETEMDSIIPDYTITLVKDDLEHLHRELDAIMAK